MKLRTLLTALTFTFFLLVYYSSTSLTFSGGAPAGYSGAPYEFTCSEAASCHIGNQNLTIGIDVTIAESGTGQIVTSYTNGQTYDITISVDDPNSSCFGFQCIIIKDSDGWSSGDFIPGPAQEIAGIVGPTSRQYVQHDSPSSTGEWTFQWEAPNTPEGPLSLHVSANAANCDYTAAGDQIYVETIAIPEFGCGVNAELLQDGGALVFNCNYDNPEPRLEFYLVGFSGGTAPYQITGTNATFSNTTAMPGDTVNVFVTQANLDAGEILLYTNDASSSCGPIDLGIIIGGFPISSLCTDIPVDTCDVSYDIVSAGAAPEILCSDLGGQPAVSLRITNFSGDNPPFLLDAEVGILTSSTAESSDTVTLFLTQSDIDAGGIDISVNDQDFNCTTSSLDAIFLGLDVFDYCGIVNECEVTYDIAGDTNGIIDLEDIQCTVNAAGNYIASIDFQNFAGANPPFFFFPVGGQVNNTFINPGGTATYTFSQTDIDNGSVSFLIDNTNALCDTISLLPILMGMSLEEICNPCDVSYTHSYTDPSNLQINCSNVGGVPTLDIDIFGMNGGTPPYFLTSDLGTLSSSTANQGETVTLSLSQSDIDAGQVLIAVNDASGACEDINILENLLLQYPSFQIIDECPDLACDITWSYAEVAEDELQITCLATDSVPLIGITLTNFSGSNPPFSLLSDNGFFVPSSVSVGGSATFYVSGGTAMAGNATFSVANGMDNCDETNLSTEITADMIQYCNDLVPVEEVELMDIDIFPNPVDQNEIVNIQLDAHSSPVHLSLSSMEGKILYSERILESEFQLYPRELGLSSGIYNVNIAYENAIIHRKLVVE